MNLMKTLFAEFVLLKGVNADSVSTDLISNIRHLCTRFMTAEIKATMSRGISGGKQVPTCYPVGCFLRLPIRVIAAEIVYSRQREPDNFLCLRSYWQVTCGSDHCYFSGLATERERHLTTGKRAEKTRLDFWCPICRSAIGQASCLICAHRRQLTFPFCR